MPDPIAHGWPRRVQSWECSDAKRFASEASALDHQRGIDAAAAAQVLLDGDATLGEVLRAFYEARWGRLADDFLANIDPAVFSLTRRSLLVISHWQCIDRPVYRIETIQPDGSFRIWGTKPGPLGSTYGGSVDVRALESYTRETLRRCGAVPCGDREAER